jgi:NTP pyrophosphatase (non-canonical NTP hydrolase)
MPIDRVYFSRLWQALCGVCRIYPKRISEIVDQKRWKPRRFVEKGWYQAEFPKPDSKNLAISLVLEASEVLEHFQWNGETVDKDALAGELADVLLYLLQLASISGIDLGQAVMDKLHENYKRTWGGNGDH